METCRRANKYIDETMPWILAKDPSKKERLETVLYNLAETIRIISVHISPFMPNTPAKIREQLGITDTGDVTWESVKKWGNLKPGMRVIKKGVIFPRLEESEHEGKTMVSPLNAKQNVPKINRFAKRIKQARKKLQLIM